MAWYIILAIVAIIAVAGAGVYVFFNLPTSEQLEKVKEWLLYAVAEAEKIFGSGTGQIKLRYVYDLFLTHFPVLAKFISFEKFSSLVDDALAKFKNLLASNEALADYVYNE